MLAGHVSRPATLHFLVSYAPATNPSSTSLLRILVLLLYKVRPAHTDPTDPTAPALLLVEKTPRDSSSEHTAVDGTQPPS
jgi:hypothetical protein